MRPLTGLTLAILAAFPAMGCYHDKGIYSVHEDRYRILYANDVVSPKTLELEPEIAAQKFRPLGALNLGFEELAQQGFKLVSVDPVLADGPATRFTFRRLVPEGHLPTNAPMEMSGLFATTPVDQNDKPIYYILDPTPAGYHVLIVTPDSQSEVDAMWDGRKLEWRNGPEENTLAMSADARSMIHTQSTLPVAGERVQQSNQTEVFRVLQPGSGSGGE